MRILGLLACLGAAGSAAGQITFIDVAPAAGVTNPSFGRGSAWVDLDGDGRLDLVTGNAGMANGFYRQLPDHTFQEMSAAWGIAEDDRATWGTIAADFDNDGDADIYFTNGGFMAVSQGEPAEGEPDQLLRNDLGVSGALSDVSAAAADVDVVRRSFGGTALDYDLDGDLDIFLATADEGTACVLLRNDGNLVFNDVAAAAGIVEPGEYRHCSMGDYNNDGWFDVAVGDQYGSNRLYRNNGDGTFTDVAVAAGVDSPNRNFGLVLEDFDNDGWMDLYVPKFQKTPTGPSLLFLNNGDGTFTDVTPGSGMSGQTDMGHNTGDVDADGYPDIYIGTGFPAWPDFDVLFLVTPDGRGGLTATDVSDSSGITSNGMTRCHGIVFADYDEDGDVDVYVNNGGPHESPETLQENYLWQSQGNGNHWVCLDLTATVSNRSAVGTRAVAYTAGGRQVHRIRRAGNGFANTDSPILHFGLGTDSALDRIEITWPTGVVQVLNAPAVDVVHEAIEPAPCRGDVTGNGVVDVEDLIVIIETWGPCPGCVADINGDDVVAVDDLVEIIAGWGPCS